MRRKAPNSFKIPKIIYLLWRETHLYKGIFYNPKKGNKNNKGNHRWKFKSWTFSVLKNSSSISLSSGANAQVYHTPNAEYSIKKIHEINSIVSESTEAVYEPPFGCSCQVEVLEQNGHSVPVCKLTPSVREFTTTVIYAHGNSSDLYDSLAFIEKMMRVFKTQFIIFDYSGYGYSRVNEVSEQSICKDL